jgi:hypothetical protein
MFDTAKDTSAPRVRQISFFLQNRVGALLGIARRLEELHVHICAISILDSIDHAVIRMVVDRPSLAKEALLEKNINLFETELIAVEVPVDKGIGLPRILTALIVAEVNVHYLYSLMVRSNSHPVVAIHVDSIDAAAHVLEQQGLALVGQDQIDWGSGA